MNAKERHDKGAVVNEIEAAKPLGLGVLTLQNYRYLRTALSYIKLDRPVRYLVSDLEEYLNAQRIVPEASEQEGKGHGI